MSAVEVEGLTKRYGEREVVSGLDLEVAPAEVVALVGPNGAGKTTTVEVLEGYRRPDAGIVRVLGLDPERDHPALRRRMGVMLQEGGLHPAIRAAEAARLFAAYHGDPRPPVDLLGAVGLGAEARTPVRRLSGGQKRRLSLALALVGSPEIVFLDEPTAGMDPRARSAAWEVVEALRAGGTTVLLATHAMDEAEALADRVAIVDRGRLVALGSPSDLGSSLDVDETRFSAAPGLDTAALAAALDLDASAVAEERPGEYRIGAAAAPELVAELAGWLRDRGVTLGDLRGTRRSLEEVFLRLTSEETAAEDQR